MRWRRLSLTFRMRSVLDGFWEVREDNDRAEIRFYTLIIYEFAKAALFQFWILWNVFQRPSSTSEKFTMRRC